MTSELLQAYCVRCGSTRTNQMSGGLMAYVGSEGSFEGLDKVRARGMGVLITAAQWRNPKPGIPWVLDNGAYSAWNQGTSLDLDRFERVLRKIPANHRPDFAVLPDVVAGGLSSLSLSLDALRWVPHGWPWYLAVQDGMRVADVAPHVNKIGGIFIGGTIGFKLREAETWTRFAHENGLKAHYARCGTADRLAHAAAIGADSVDSMSWARNDTYHLLDEAAQATKTQTRLEVATTG